MKCRHCQQDMYIHSIQEYPAKYNLAPLTLIECHNPGCPLWMQTLNQVTYPTMDLTPYLKGKVLK